MPSYADDIIRDGGPRPLDDVHNSDESRLDQGFAERDEPAASRFGVADAEEQVAAERLFEGRFEMTEEAGSKIAALGQAQEAASALGDAAGYDDAEDDLGDEMAGDSHAGRYALRRARREALARGREAHGGQADGQGQEAHGGEAAGQGQAARGEAAHGAPSADGRAGAGATRARRAGAGQGFAETAPAPHPEPARGAAGAADAERAREAVHAAAEAHGVVATGAPALAGETAGALGKSAHLRDFFRIIRAKAAAAGGAAKAGVGAWAATAKQLVLAGGAKGALALAAPAAAVLLLVVSMVLGLSTCTGLAGGILDETTTANDAGLSGSELAVAEYLLGHGLDEVHAAAVMANMRAESGGVVGEEFDTGSIEAGSGAGHGLCQWTGGRWSGPDGLLAFASRQGKEWTDIAVQLDFFWSEYSSHWSGSYMITSQASDSPPAGTHVYGSKSSFAATDDLHDATRFFCYGWERPGIPHESKRLAFADAYYALLTGAWAEGAGKYIAIATSIAADDSHGYSLGASGPDEYDCQGFVKHCLAQAGYDTSPWGFDAAGTGTGAARDGLKAMGFDEHAYTGHEGVPAGAIMLYHHYGTASGHVAIYLGDGRIVEAIGDYDGRPGDSSGQEIRVCADWAKGLWQYYYTPPQ